MSARIMKLPFVTWENPEKEEISFPAELACVVCLAESQRKKSSFLRETAEKTAFLSKVYYPMWVLKVEKESILLDGLATEAHLFRLNLPVKTAVFIEELKKNAVIPQMFIEVLRTQVKHVKETTSQADFFFRALIDDEELLGFFSEYLKNGEFQEEQRDAIPPEADWETALASQKAVANCLRTVEADARGLRQALALLKEELAFQEKAATSELEFLKEKLEAEITVLKPAVEETVKKLAAKQEKAVSVLQKDLERKLATLDKGRENYMRKLHVAEQRRDSAKAKIEAAKNRKNSPKTSSGTFALKKYERELDNVKKEVKTLTEKLEKTKKEGENLIKQKNSEFQAAIDSEESKLIQLNARYAAKAYEKNHQTKEMTELAAKIALTFENTIDDLKQKANTFKRQVLLRFELDNPETAVFAQLPIYLAKFVKGKEERYKVLTPLAISQDGGVLKEFKSMLSRNPEPKLKALARPANKRLQETVSSDLERKIHADPDFCVKLNELCRSTNLLDQNIFGQTLNEGLDELERKSWITHEEAAIICKRVMGDSA